MVADNSSTLVRRSTKRSSREDDFSEWEIVLMDVAPLNLQLSSRRYAIIFEDNDGSLKATGSDLFKDTRGWFTQDFRERLQGLLPNPSDQSTQLPSERPVKRYRASINDSLKQKSLAIALIPDWTNTQQAWVELTEPGRQSTHPYKGGDKAKPEWWPENVRYCTPHHMPKEELLTLMTHILRMSGKGRITCAQLADAPGEFGEETREALKEITELRKIEEQAEKQREHDALLTSSEIDEELNHSPSEAPTLGSDEERRRCSAGSPDDPIEVISPADPSPEACTGLVTPTSYTFTSEAPANWMWDCGSPYQTPYPGAQSISYRAPFRQVCPSHP
ncbi:hypothetical protein IFM51744_10554 [Aspergillus udagawae]|nr:hypothetical protein IFM51744_10554 [Aspergillus udagawae]